ncbi:MAG: TetR family transcriptional regulator [Gammaproteobacteria bacterium]|nr:MAG: TetR family transcriptional regulator [Gammaproteobacteria bacterium]
MTANTRRKLLETGLQLLLERGYNGLGVQELLQATRVPKGSFYHHFESKQDFALRVVDCYMAEVHAGLDACLDDDTRPPLQRIRRFFELSRDKYGREGHFGCMLGGLGQELSGTSDVFRRKIENCFVVIVDRIAGCLALACERGDFDAETDPHAVANLILNCWEGAALRSRLWRHPAPLDDVLDFCFRSLKAGSAFTP